MNGLRLAVTPLRVLLVLTFLALIVAEVMAFPGQFAHWAREDADFRPYRWPVLAVFEVGMVCVQVVILSTWKLLSMVQSDRVFTSAALRWVDVIIWAVSIAWVLLAGLLGLVVVLSDDPGNAFAAVLVLLPATVFALLMVVMRALLEQATTLRTDMEAVI